MIETLNYNPMNTNISNFNTNPLLRSICLKKIEEVKIKLQLCVYDIEKTLEYQIKLSKLLVWYKGNFKDNTIDNEVTNEILSGIKDHFLNKVHEKLVILYDKQFITIEEKHYLIDFKINELNLQFTKFIEFKNSLQNMENDVRAVIEEIKEILGEYSQFSTIVSG